MRQKVFGINGAKKRNTAFLMWKAFFMGAFPLQRRPRSLTPDVAQANADRAKLAAEQKRARKRVAFYTNQMLASAGKERERILLEQLRRTTRLLRREKSQLKRGQSL